MSAGETVTLVLTGDVMLGRLVNEVLHVEPPTYPWGDLLPFLRNADLTVINLECVIARGGRPWPGKVFHFRADPEVAIPALQVAGIDAICLANNHVMDFHAEAALEMLAYLQRAGIAYAGFGPDLAAASRPAILRAGRLTIGLVAFTDNEPEWAAGPNRPGVNYIPIIPDEPRRHQVATAIQAARQAGADFVIASFHWGPNMRLEPSPDFVAFAHMVMDAGADLFHGHSAHVFQGIEIYHGKPIFYDCGDFVDDYAVDPVLRNDWALLYQVTVSRQGVEAITLIPALISRCQVNRAHGRTFDVIADRLADLSRRFHTAVERRAGVLAIPVHRPAPA